MDKENSIGKKLKEIMGKAGPVIAVIILCIFLTIRTDRFLTINNIMNIARQTSMSGFLALGMMVCILTAGIDLSVGFTMTLSTIVMAKCAVEIGLTPLLCLVICVVTGALLGLINGLLLTKCKLPHPFISTMGTQNIYKGIGLVLTGATPIAGMPMIISWAGSAAVGKSTGTILDKIPVSFILMLIMYFIFSIFLNYTRLGRHIYAVGGSITTAELSGINVDFVRTSVYVISGIMAALGGIIAVGRSDSAYPLSGLLLENDAIAAVIIGGTSFFGGKGNVLGTFFGVLLISVLRNGLNLLKVSSDMQTIFLGVIIIIAVFIDVVRNGGFKRVKRMKKDEEK
ncbi:MAG TPA: sugar ABC transporter permease [Lachnospiraceae bacterium]|jgi:ribose transport system permease protein|uniref:ABC transporter permease n=1 Tax=Muricomes intestini TaxID=1796634 RepID=UPI000EE82916|nr:sugar ABC transporter permease [Lachnospiraceae bacterium]